MWHSGAALTIGYTAWAVFPLALSRQRRTAKNSIPQHLQPWREFQQFPAHLAPITRVNKWIYCTCSLEALQTTVFHCFPGWLSLHTGPSVISLLPAGCTLRDRVPIDIISRSLLPISTCFIYLFLCKSCSISPQLFFRSNCSLHRCRFSVSLGGDEFNTFLHCHLGQKPNLLFIHFFIYSKWQNHISKKKMILTTFH